MVLVDWLRSWTFPRQQHRSHSRHATGTSRLLTLLSRRPELLEDRSLLTAGALDPTFGSDGIVLTHIGEEDGSVAVNASALQPDGKIVLVGAVRQQELFMSSLPQDVMVARFTADGKLDPSFDGDGIARLGIGPWFESGRAVSILDDGKILIAGEIQITDGDDTDLFLIRLNANGSLDTTFDNDGIVTTHFAQPSHAQDMTVLPDGRIIVAGSLNEEQFLAVRYNPDGSLDTSFDDDGYATTTFSHSTAAALCLTVQNDGKLLLAGWANDHAMMAAARYNTDGSLDTTFDTDGLVTISNTSIATSIALKADGRIVLGGSWLYPSSSIALVQLLSNGTLDTSFDSDGKWTGSSGFPYPANGKNYVQDILIQPDGKLLYSYVYGAQYLWSPDHFYDGAEVPRTAVGRLNADGTKDSTFGFLGWAVPLFETSTSSVGSARSLLPLPDGSIVASGVSIFGRIGVVRLTPDGLLDPSFDDDGRAGVYSDAIPAGVPTSEQATGVTIQQDGRILVVGTTNSQEYHPGWNPYDTYQQNGFIARYDAAGNLDTSWDGEAKLFTHPYGTEGNGLIVAGTHQRDDFHDVISMPNGRVYTAASLGRNNFNIVSSFDDGQFRDYGYLGSLTSGAAAYAVLAQPDGKMVAVGKRSSLPSSAIVVRTVNVLEGSGVASIDATFGSSGVVALSLSSGSEAFECVALQADGKILAAGWANAGANKQLVVVRLNSNGTLDTSFSSDGVVTLSFGGTDERAQGIAVQADGKILVGGYSATGPISVPTSSSFVLARLLEDGSLDTSFDSDGVVTTSFGGLAFARGLVIQSDGKAILGGDAGNAFALARYNTDGSLDTTFDGDGLVTNQLAVNTIAHQGSDLALRNDGSIVLAGGVTYIDGRNDIAVARYLGDAVVTAPVVTHVSEDRGRHDRDGVTNDQTLIIYGEAVPNRTLEIFRDGVLLGASESNGLGKWAFDDTATVLSEGEYDFTARVNGETVSILSEPFTVTIDLSTPTAAVPSSISDTGVSSNDRVTRELTYARGTAEVDSSVELWLDGVQYSIGDLLSSLPTSELSSVAYRTANSVWGFRFPYNLSLAPGTHQIVTRVTDLAGNSTFSEPWTFTFGMTVVPVSLSSLGTVTEGSTATPFSLEMAGANDYPITIGLSQSGTATAGADFTALSSTTVSPGTLSKPLNLLLDDTLYEGDETLTVDIATVSSNGMEVGTQAATVTIVENDAPTLSDIGNVSTPVGVATAPVAFVLGNFAAGVNVPVAATSSNTALVPNDGFVFSGSGANRTLTVAPVSGRSGQVTITVTAGHGIATVSRTFVVTVGVHANQPTVSAIAMQVISEDTPLAPVSFTIADDDSAAADLIVTAHAVDVTLVPGEQIVLGGNGSTRSIAIAPAANRFGTTSIVVTVTDASGMTRDAVFTMQIDAVNDAPEIALASNASTNSVSPIDIPFTVIDLETPVDQLVIDAKSSNRGVIPAGGVSVVGTGANRILRLTPAAGIVGNSTITLSVDDTQGETTTKTITVAVTQEFDFGDAPDTGATAGTGPGNYQTRMFDDGPRHLVGGPHLGPTVDAEIAPNTYLEGFANSLYGYGDNTFGNDEDGIFFPSMLRSAPGSGTQSTVVVNASTTARVDAWLDFNADGDFADSGEQIATSVAVVSGDNVLSFVVPASSPSGKTFARFRISNSGNLAPTGLALDGEVEDVAVVITGASALAVIENAILSHRFANGVLRTGNDPSFYESGSQKAWYILDPYFSTIAVRALLAAPNVGVADKFDVAATHLSFWLSHALPNGTIPRLIVDANGDFLDHAVTDIHGTTFNPANIGADADDSAWALLMSLAAEYQAAGGPAAVLHSLQPKLELIADKLVGLIQPNGLTNTFLEFSGTQFQYTLDAMEVAQAFRQFATLEGVFYEDQTKATLYANAAATVAEAIQEELLDSATQLYKAYADTIHEVAPAPDLNDWYPLVFDQVWPIITDLIPATSAEARQLLNQVYSTWDGSTHIDWTTRTDVGWFAWAALRAGDTEFAAASVQSILPWVLQNSSPYPATTSSYNGDSALGSNIAHIGYVLQSLLPAANPDIVVTPFETAVEIDVRANDYSVSTPQNELVIAITAGPTSGTAVVVNGRVLYTPDAEFKGDDSFEYQVQAQDGGTRTALVMVHVNHPPQLAGDTTITFVEDSGAKPVNSGLSVSDLDSGTLSSAVITLTEFVANEDELGFVSNPATMGNIAIASNSSGILRLVSSGSTATLAQWQAALRSVTYRNLSNIPTTTPRQVDIQVNDGLDVSLVSRNTIGISPVNDAPSISDIANQATDEDTTSSVFGFTVGDIESAVGSLTVTAVSSDTILVPVGNISVGGSGANRTVTVTPAPNRFGNATITVTVSDGTTSTSDSFILTVNPINDAPSISDVGDQTTDEDVPLAALPITIGDLETAASGLSVTATSSDTTLIPNLNFSFSGTGANRLLTVSPAANQFGSATITVTVSDGNLTATDTFVVTVAPLNDAPTVSDIANQVTNEDTASSAIPFLVGDLETAASSLLVTVTSSNTLLVPNANLALGGSGTSRTVTATPTTNQVGTTTITLSVSDGTLTTTDTFVLTVGGVNDAPVISAIDAQSTNEDTPSTPIAFTISDIETASSGLSLSATSSNGLLVPNGNLNFGGSGSNRTLVVTPAANQFGTTDITITVSDGTVSETRLFELTVVAVNDAPTISNLTDVTINEETSTTALSFTIGDVETSGTSLVFTAKSSNTTLVPDGNFAIGGSGANRTLTVTPAANQFGSAIITVTVSDGTTSSSDTFVLTVIDINDAPTITDLGNLTIQ